MTAIKKRLGLAQQMLNNGSITYAQFYTWQRLARDGYDAGMAGNPKTTHYDRSYVDGGVGESDYAMQCREIVNKILDRCGRTGGPVLDYVCIKGESLAKVSGERLTALNEKQVSGILISSLCIAAEVYWELDREIKATNHETRTIV